mgnify:FL=1
MNNNCCNNNCNNSWNTSWNNIRGRKMNYEKYKIDFNIINKRILAVVNIEINNLKKIDNTIPNKYGKWIIK